MAGEEEPGGGLTSGLLQNHRQGLKSAGGQCFPNPAPDVTLIVHILDVSLIWHTQSLSLYTK